VPQPLLPPGEIPGGRFLGVNCINPQCGRLIDVASVWPKDKRAFAHTVECPDCRKLSTYSHHEVRVIRTAGLRS
jgi:ribosomal protein S27E